MDERRRFVEGSERPDLGDEATFRIFLNYRREDAAPTVGRLWDTLRKGTDEIPGFAESQIFKDIDTIEPGVDFRDAIRTAVESSDVFLAIIGTQWLGVVDATGRRRLDSPGDFVRIEIEAALERAARHRDVRIVPTLVEGAAMPEIEQLPDSLSSLAHRHAVELTYTRWSFDAGRLLAWLKKLEREKSERVAAARSRREAAKPLRLEPTGRAAVEEVARERARREAADRSARERAEQDVLGRRSTRRSAAWTLGASRRLQTAVGAALLALTATVAVVALADGDPPVKPPEDGVGYVWTPVEVSLGVARLLDVTTDPNGATIAVGQGDRRPKVVASNDGVEWSEHSVEGGSGAINAVVASERVVLAAGKIDDSSEDVDAGIWKRTGDHWTLVCREVCGDLAASRGRQEVNSLTVTSTGNVVAVGRDAPGNDFDAAVWFSRNGDEWERRAASDESLRGPRDQVMQGVVATGDRLVAVGWSGVKGAVWMSDDEGESWRTVPTDSLPSSDGIVRLRAVAARSFSNASRSARAVAVGYHEIDGKRSAAAWFSDDRGSTWQKASISDGRSGRAQMVDVIPVRDGWLAVGDANPLASVWRSSDGQTWTGVSSDAFAGGVERNMTSAVALPGEQIVVVGSGKSGEGGRAAAIWSSGTPE